MYFVKIIYYSALPPHLLISLSKLVSWSPVFCCLIFLPHSTLYTNNSGNSMTTVTTNPLCYSFVLNFLWLPMACRIEARIPWMAFMNGPSYSGPTSLSLNKNSKLLAVLSCSQWIKPYKFWRWWLDQTLIRWSTLMDRGDRLEEAKCDRKAETAEIAPLR